MAYLDDDSLPFKGRMGKISIYVTKKGKRIVRPIGGPTAKQMKTDPAFETARKNGSEFGRASRMGKFFRSMLKPIMLLSPDGDFNNRLNGQLRKLIQLDTSQEFGRKGLTQENLPLLPRIYLNDASMADLVTVASSADTITIRADFREIKKYLKQKKNPGGATHFQVFSLVITQSSHTIQKPLEIKESSLIAISDKTSSPLLNYDLIIPARSYARVHAIAIVFYRAHKGDLVMLGDRSMNGGWLEGILPPPDFKPG